MASSGSSPPLACRTSWEVVEDLDAGISEMARVLRPGGSLIVFTVFRTNLLEPKEAELLIGWREYAEERSQPSSQALLRLARLRRQRDNVVE